jgi:hypothetical protein
MRKIFTGTLFVGTAAATAIGLNSPPALAATWTVSNGGHYHASGNAVLNFGNPITCSVSTFDGTMQDGSGLSGGGIATIENAKFGTSTNPCTGSGVTGTGAQSLGSIWNVNAIAYNPDTGTTSETITGIVFTFTVTDLLGSCTVQVTGETDSVTYTNSTHMFTIAADNPPRLTIVSATGTGCASLFNAGTTGTWSGKYSITSDAGGSPVITSQ